MSEDQERFEEIVCDYVMDGNPKISLWNQESCNVI